MAIVYGAISWTSTMTTRDKVGVSIRLAVAPVGTVLGAIMVNQKAIPIETISAQQYRAFVYGGDIGTCLNAPVSITMQDAAGPVAYAGPPLTLTVTHPGEPNIPDPAEFLRDLILQHWDTNFHKKPTVILQSEEKGINGFDLKGIHVTIAAKKTQTKARAQGRHKDNRYPLEILVRSEGLPNSKQLAKDGMAEVMRIVELHYNYLPDTWHDFIEFEDDGQDMSYAAAGRYEWRWNIRMVGVLRGRAGTSTPET